MRITECTKPKDALGKDWQDCNICHFAKCGYSRCYEPNPYWEEQKGFCAWEHCIENQPLGEERTDKSCPTFGHDCPGGVDQAKECQRVELADQN